MRFALRALAFKEPPWGALRAPSARFRAREPRTGRGEAASAPVSGPRVRPCRGSRAKLDIVDFELTDEQMKEIATLDTGSSLFVDHRDPGLGRTGLSHGHARPSTNRMASR